MNELLEEISALRKGRVIEQFTQEPRSERRVSLPYGYTDSFYSDILNSAIGADNVWVHQAEAMEAISSGLNAVLSTGTASGKSLIFQMAAIHKVMKWRAKGIRSRVMVIYPTRALNNDQTSSWKKIIAAAGFPDESLGQIDGSVAVSERLDILAKSDVLLMTPDTCHSWLMSNLDTPEVQEFIANLNLKILDECQFYDGVFGTNMSYLLRRILFAQKMLNPKFRVEDHGQIIMATATLNDPRKFAIQLTGTDAWIIDESQNTSPRDIRNFTVIRTPDRKRTEMLTNLLIGMGRSQLEGSILAFVDSRRKVEEVSHDANATLGLGNFMAYRSGLTKEDRISIEQRLREGLSTNENGLKGVVSTSALEAGIDIAGIKYVILDGLPPDSSSFVQRAGRLRKGGEVIILAEEKDLRSVKSSVKDYFYSPPRQPVFYRTNPKLQAEQAVCLVDEMTKMGVPIDRVDEASWPAGFTENVNVFASNELQLTDIQRAALAPPDTTPQYYHGLRSIDGPTRRLIIYNPAIEKSVSIGEVTQGQAIREALPGMIVHANGRQYRVKSWGEKTNSPIMVRALSGDEFANRLRTRATVKTETRIYLNDKKIIKGRLLKNGDANFIADCKLTIDRSAAGFIETLGKDVRRVFYSDKHEEDKETYFDDHKSKLITHSYGGQRKMHFDTSGVVIRIGEAIMSDSELARLGYLLSRALCEAINVSPNDIGVLTRNITVGVDAKTALEDRAIVIYDKTPGSLYFSSKIVTSFDKVVTHMRKMLGPADQHMAEVIGMFILWCQELERVKPPTYNEWLSKGASPQNDNQIQVYAPDSRLILKDGDAREWVQVVGAEITHQTFMYKVRKIGAEFRPHPSKMQSHRVGVRQLAAEYFNVRFVPADKLEQPNLPTYRFGIFDKGKNAYLRLDAET